ncbi:MAG: LLM class flavin-dependent oxidoreductase, partial [Dehalococcoidia bacterium]
MSKMRYGVGIFGNEPLPKIMAQIKLAEEMGYDSAWLIDSQLTCREVYVTLAACALTTSRIKLGTGVTAPYTRHASVTASAFATLNEIAPGRLLLGISIGQSLVRTIGYRPAKIRELEEYVGVLRGLLNNEKVRFEGDVEGKITWMKKPSQIPIYVAGSGPRITQAAGRIADGVILHHGLRPSQIERGLGQVRDGVAEVGKSMDQVDVVCWAITSVSPDGGLAREHVRGRVAAMLAMAAPERFDEEDREAILRIRKEYDFSRVGSPALDKFIDMYALAGTP